MLSIILLNYKEPDYDKDLILKNQELKISEFSDLLEQSERKNSEILNELNDLKNVNTKINSEPFFLGLKHKIFFFSDRKL